MKKRLLSLILTICMSLSLLPATATAAEGDPGNFADENVTWIGTQAEYQKTLDQMFVNGMRKMKAGTKWGIVDATGEWVAPPIYDTIELNYLVARDGLTGKPLVSTSESLEMLFLDGYTQCVRGGKMGLLNAYGEEAIPAQYDAVGLPSEGICRIIKKSGSTAYLGYWSLELGRELVAPNKYMTTNASAEGGQMVRQMLDSNSTTTGIGGSHDQTTGSSGIDYQQVTLPSGNRLAAQHDFMDGYVLVTTGQGSGGIMYGTILDKTGKEILPGGPYPYRPGTYPQFGPYMIYVKQSDKVYTSDRGDLGYPLLSGVVGPEGIIIPAQYTGGVRSPITGWYVGDARMTIIPELKLVITAKDTAPGKENGGRVGVVNFQNKTVIPFTHDFNYFTYNAQHKVFGGISYEGGSRLYLANGKRLNNKDYFEIGNQNKFIMVNGFTDVMVAEATTINGKSDSTFKTGFVNLKTGAEFFPAMLESQVTPCTDFSVNGTVWVQNPDKKWGLLDGTGKVVLPFQYDALDGGDWGRAKDGYAIVNIGQKQGVITTDGKQVIPCEYEKLYAPAGYGPIHPEYIEATKDGKMGLISMLTGKLVIPCSYRGIGSVDVAQYQSEYFTLGANPVRTGDKTYALVDKNGNMIPGTNQPNYISAPNRGLFYTTKVGYIDAQGRTIFPDTISYAERKNSMIEDTTLVVRDGKVGYINADKLAKPTQPKKLNPTKATAAPSATKLIVDGKAVAVNAYEIGGNNYIKVRDMAYLVNSTAKNFEVTYDNAKNAINLKSGSPYTTVKGDMSAGAAGKKTAARSGSAIYVDGLRHSLTAYEIGGNNFFKLRDVMQVFDVFVGYDAASATATLDTSRSYELSDAEKAAIIPASTEIDAPPASQTNKLEVLKSPGLEFYMTGNHTFSTAGFELRHWDDKGVAHIITDVSEMVFTVEGKVIEDGYVFTASSMKTGTVGYKGLTAPLRFPVYQGVAPTEPDKAPGQTDAQIADGNYTISIMGNTVGISNGWLVLDSKNPTTFSVKNEGDYYTIHFEDVTKKYQIGISPANSQLITNSKGQWTITNLGGDTYSVRQYDKPDMVVNASGESSKDGTKVIVWKSKATPKNAILTFTLVK